MKHLLIILLLLSLLKKICKTIADIKYTMKKKPPVRPYFTTMKMQIYTPTNLVEIKMDNRVFIPVPYRELKLVNINIYRLFAHSHNHYQDSHWRKYTSDPLFH